MTTSAALAAPQISEAAAAQVQVMRELKASRSAVQAKIDSRLYMAVLNARRDSRLSALPDFRYIRPEADGRIGVDVILARPEGVKGVMEFISGEARGVVNSFSRVHQRVSGRVRITDLEELAALPHVRKVRQAMPGISNGMTVSQGDLTHGAQQARGIFGTTGVGVKVCVLANGVNSLAALQASGELPAAVDVLAGQAGSGEDGTAMLEIIHDIAPGAALGFATSGGSATTMASNIGLLVSADCDVIVDDTLFPEESPFQDGPIAQAVDAATSAGVLYFSAAGDQGNAGKGTSGTWEGDFLISAAAVPPPLAGVSNLHNFGDGGNSILVTFGGRPLLIWAEHYDAVSGIASTDFDLYVMNSTLTTVFDASTDVQDGAGGDDFPIEFVSGGTFTGERVLIDRFAAGSTSSVPMFNLIVLAGQLDSALATAGALRGHGAAAAAFAVAATPAAASFDGVTADGPFPGLFSAANEIESFSADGPRRVILGPTGTELTPGNRTSTGGVVRAKPDITAADGVATTTPGLNPFYGTSASAPHAAAIAALIKSAVPAITPAQLRTALISSAIDIEGAGVDQDSGAGIVMAEAALIAAGAPPGASLTAGTPLLSEVVGDGDAFVEPNEIWDMQVPLSNAGSAASSIVGTLGTLSAGVTVNAASSPYPDLAVGASANNTTAFRFTVGPALTCGALIEFSLSVALTGGSSPQAFPLTVRSAAPGTPVNFAYSGAALPIPDGADLTGNAPGAPVNADVIVSGMSANVYDVNLSIDGATCNASTGSTTVGIEHSFVNDLELVLRSPGGSTALVVDNTDGSGNNLCQTVLDDQSAGPSIQSVVTSAAPFTGSFTPATPLAAFNASAADGNWQLQAQDFFSQDTGNIRALSLQITPAVCDAPVLVPDIEGTKAVSAGPYSPGDTVTYTVVLSNTGTGAQLDNPGDEFVDVLPAQLTLVSATATSGTALATVGTNTVSWNGSIAAAGSITITITATINPGTFGATVTNQGTINFDADQNGSNETTALTDDPALGGGSDPTVFTVSNGTAAVGGSKSVSAGPYNPGDTVTYSIVLNNSGSNTQADNPGDEFIDVLPAQLTLVSATASSGTAIATVGTNTVTWNGSIAAAGSVTITITATINPGTFGAAISNQGTINFDADQNGSNESSAVTDAPGGAANEPTVINVIVGTASITGTKSVAAGSALPGGAVTYTIVLSNTGLAPQGDNPGDEFVDVLPAQLTLVSATANSGAAVATLGTNTVTWNGAIPSAGSVTITISATINAGTFGATVVNQGTISFDADADGTNETTGLTDAPGGVVGDPTVFRVSAVLQVPSVSTQGLLLMLLMLLVTGGVQLSTRVAGRS